MLCKFFTSLKKKSENTVKHPCKKLKEDLMPTCQKISDSADAQKSSKEKNMQYNTVLLKEFIRAIYEQSGRIIKRFDNMESSGNTIPNIKEQLAKRHQELKGELYHMLELSDDELKENSLFRITETNDGHWFICTQYCNIGGCELRGCLFETEHTAALYAYILTVLGFKPRSTVCKHCKGKNVAA